MIPDGDGFRMTFVQIDILADPDFFPDFNPAQFMQERPEVIAAGNDHRDLMKQSVQHLPVHTPLRSCF